jgi:hypothetical protein
MRIAIHSYYSIPAEYAPMYSVDALTAPIVTVEKDDGAILDVIYCDGAADLQMAISEARLSFGSDIAVKVA